MWYSEYNDFPTSHSVTAWNGYDPSTSFVYRFAMDEDEIWRCTKETYEEYSPVEGRIE